jgi:quercetin dioxygenase-like cupin family protein
VETGDLELIGNEKEKIIEKCRSLFSSWGLTLPDVPGCAFHFGLHNFNRIGEVEFDINNNIQEGYCGKFIVIFKGQVCPMHYHAIKHETFYLVKGRVEMTAGEETYVMHQGDIRVMPQHTPHLFKALETSLILECSKPDIISDSIFTDPQIAEIIAGCS